MSATVQPVLRGREFLNTCPPNLEVNGPRRVTVLTLSVAECTFFKRLFGTKAAFTYPEANITTLI